MKSISIRNVPDNVYRALQEMAKKNRRSLQEQVKFFLERELKLSNRSFLAGAAGWRKRLKGRKLKDTEKMVRKDRE
jgi:predicted CopG family antitoxin